MKYQISTAVLAFIAIVSTIVAFASPSSQDCQIQEWYGEIEGCEQTINQLDSTFSFSDTVAEGDAYCCMEEARDAFLKTDEFALCKAYHKTYMMYYKRVIKESLTIIKQHAVEDYKDSLPIHVCGKGE